MKRILGVLMLLFFISACNDGRLTFDAIDFSQVPAQKCPDKDVIYKIKDNEMLVIEIPATTFITDQTVVGTPIEVPLSGTVKVTYRKYAGTVSSQNVCGTFPSATPSLMEQWNATSGIIEITATAIKTANATDNSTRITGYIYNINFKNITFQKPGGDQVYPSFPFGNYTTTVSALAFGFNHVFVKSTCTADNRIFDFSGGEVFTLDIANYSALFDSAITQPGMPRTALISVDNKFSYRLYSNAITNAYFCASPPPTTPTLSQQWDAVAGVAATSGIIEVTTTTLASGFQHTIHLKNVTLKQGNSDFNLGSDYILGTLVTN
jgi:hypothetical protein